MEDFVNLKYKNEIAEITFGTKKSNAMPGKILEALAEKIIEAGKSPAKAILLKSAGEKAFCAGASFDELLEITELEASEKFFGGFAKVVSAMKNCGKIIVARVQGKTTGGGVGIACAADYCFAVRGAHMALTEINLGIGPFVIGPYVERKIGNAAFTAMMIDAEFRSAEWCGQKNIYNQIFDTIPEMDAALEEFMKTLAGRSADALGLIKKISWEGTEHFDDLMPERAKMSAALVLEPFAKRKIQEIKQRLGKGI